MEKEHNPEDQEPSKLMWFPILMPYTREHSR